MTLTTPSDVSLLQAIADPDRYRILIYLLRTPATQKQLSDALELNSGVVSKHMKVLRGVHLAQRRRSHSSYEPLFPERLRELLQAAANLKLEITEAQQDLAELEAEVLRNAGIHVAPEKERSA